MIRRDVLAHCDSSQHCGADRLGCARRGACEGLGAQGGRAGGRARTREHTSRRHAPAATADRPDRSRAPCGDRRTADNSTPGRDFTHAADDWSSHGLRPAATVHGAPAPSARSGGCPPMGSRGRVPRRAGAHTHGRARARVPTASARAPRAPRRPAAVPPRAEDVLLHRAAAQAERTRVHEHRAHDRRAQALERRGLAAGHHV